MTNLLHFPATWTPTRHEALMAALSTDATLREIQKRFDCKLADIVERCRWEMREDARRVRALRICA